MRMVLFAVMLWGTAFATYSGPEWRIDVAGWETIHEVDHGRAMIQKSRRAHMLVWKADITFDGPDSAYISMYASKATSYSGIHVYWGGYRVPLIEHDDNGEGFFVFNSDELDAIVKASNREFFDGPEPASYILDPELFLDLVSQVPLDGTFQLIAEDDTGETVGGIWKVKDIMDVYDQFVHLTGINPYP